MKLINKIIKFVNIQTLYKRILTENLNKMYNYKLIDLNHWRLENK